MTALNKMVAVVALATLGMMSFGSEAKAADRYVSVSFHNDTNLKITYRFRWGTGNWKTITVRPGNTHWHSYLLESEYQFVYPVPVIRYDGDAGERRVSVENKLKAYRTTKAGSTGSKRYEFRRLQDLNGIYLKPIN